MSRSQSYSWAVTAAAAAMLVVSTVDAGDPPPLSTFLFWISLLATVQLLPMSLPQGAEVTMGFPLHLALALLFPPWVGMVISGIGAMDVREFRRELTPHRIAFNRSQSMISVGLASVVFSLYGRDLATGSIRPSIILAIALAATANTGANLSLVVGGLHYQRDVPWTQALRALLPDPIGGFVLTYAILAGLGAATAIVYENVRFGAWAVAAFIIPLLFARLSIVGARAQQRLTERIQKQQEALLEATERVLGERERERHRIAEDIHDSSLQMLTAATYGCENAEGLLKAGNHEGAAEAVAMARGAIQGAMIGLRDSLADLRGTSLKGDLMQTVHEFADEASTLWGAEVRVHSELKKEPPSAVALAAFQILQEGVTNALKHGDGAPVAVRLTEGEGTIHMVVEDQGPGFDTSQEVGEEHVGLRLMKERAARVGGQLLLESKPSEGTRLEVSLPGGVST
jgi:signal transduction histidine kinase